MEPQKHEKSGMNEKDPEYKGITIKKTEVSVSDIRTTFEGSSTHSQYKYEEYSSSNVYSHSYDEDDEVFLEGNDTTPCIAIKREPRPRRTSDVIDSLGEGSPLKEITHFTFPEFVETGSDYSTSRNTLSSSRFQSPPVTPGSDLGYYSTSAGTGLSTPPYLLNYKHVWSRISSPTMDMSPQSKWNDSFDGKSKWDESDSKPFYGGSYEEAPPSRTQTAVARMSVAKDSNEYNMDHEKRGYAVIFNNEMFASEPTRKGTDIDVSLLKRVYETLGFEVDIHNDLTYDEIRGVITKLSMQDFSNCDCLSMTVLTHGIQNNFLHSRDIIYPLDVLWKPFTGNSCPTLAGKPKIFFVQACKGEGFDGGVKMVSRTETDSGCTSYKIPNMADFLIFYSTVEGYYSWRNPETGTWFIQTLCNVLVENHKTMDLMKMMTLVTRKVALDFESFNDRFLEQHGQKQVPSMFSTLLRDVYFRPKEA